MNGVLEAFYSLGKNINKRLSGQNNGENEEGIVSEKIPELALNMSNEDLLKVTGKWEKEWLESDTYQQWKKKIDENERYWLGDQYEKINADKARPLVDNVIFEGLETYLPQITRRNPDPMVELKRTEDQGEDIQTFAKDLQKDLAEIADEQKLRLKLKKVGRHWAIYLLGAAKLGWDLDRDIPIVKIVRPQKLILDPNATVDEDGYSGERIGEYRKMSAGKLISTLEDVGGEAEGTKMVKETVGDKLGTELQFIEWWTDEYMCWKMNETILLKKQNPHWNYGTSEPVMDEDGQPVLDAEGKPTENTTEGFNHFPVPKMPWLLLSVYNLGKTPVDETSLITQNLANQDLINKRVKQIDKNADSMNGGMVVSGERSGLSQQQASKVTDALRRGGTVFIPAGAVSDAIARMSAPGLPADVYNQLNDTRNRTRDIFGTRGSTPAGTISEATVRGKIQNRQLDTDRIGGGFSEYLEQLADDIYNWFTQLLYVYDDNYAGKQHPKVKISVKEGSLLPKDSSTIANQAIELAGAGKMSLVDLYKRLDYSNPEELASNVWLEINAPEVLYGNDPRIQQVIQARQAAAQNTETKAPSESISFKDLSPDAKAQMLAKVGIIAHPEAIAAYDEGQKAQDRSVPVVPAGGETVTQ